MDINNILKTNCELIKNTILQVKNKLMFNWLNIFPYKLEDYKESNLYKNFSILYDKKQFDYVKSDNFILGLLSKITSGLPLTIINGAYSTPPPKLSVKLALP